MEDLDDRRRKGFAKLTPFGPAEESLAPLNLAPPPGLPSRASVRILPFQPLLSAVHCSVLMTVPAYFVKALPPEP